ncbi:MAG TPA: tetratricopeptide repeat protein, partial [Pyrinomonadaceae bacterium]
MRSIMRRQLPTLQFNSQSNLLTESTGGAYLLLEGSKSRLPIAIPNRSHLTSKQDYYACYYELFNCDNAVAGEVVVLSPAVIEKVENGWALIEPGSFEIKVGPEARLETQEEPSIACKKCGTQVDPRHTFCKRCGSPLQSDEADLSVESVAPDIHQDIKFPELTETAGNTTEPNAITPDYHWKPIFGVVGGLAALGITLVVIISLSVSGNSVEKRLDTAIKAGNLFAPANENAHDLYLQLKNSGASEQTLRPYRERILPLLTSGPLQMIKEFMVPGSDDVPITEWQGAARSLRWATDLRPDDGGLRARTLYAEGRIAYLSKDENNAISTWERAADADPSWPLPINGIGLIYTGRKDYESARRYYQIAIQRDSNWAYPYNNMGTAYFMQRNYYEAKGFYQKAAQLAPRWARPHSWLGDIAMKEED